MTPKERYLKRFANRTVVQVARQSKPRRQMVELVIPPKAAPVAMPDNVVTTVQEIQGAEFLSRGPVYVPVLPLRRAILVALIGGRRALIY